MGYKSKFLFFTYSLGLTPITLLKVLLKVGKLLYPTRKATSLTLNLSSKRSFREVSILKIVKY